MSTHQWTFLTIGLGMLALGASGLRWTKAWERHGVRTTPFGIKETAALTCVCGLLFLLAIAADGIGTFMLCLQVSFKGLVAVSGNVGWLFVATWVLVEGIGKRNYAEIGAGVFLFLIPGLFGLLTWVFGWQHFFVKPIIDFIDCF
jgi:hypothetical protein